MCIFTFSHRYHLLEKRNANFVIIPFRHLNFKRYPDTFINRYYYDKNTDTEVIGLSNNLFSNLIAEVQVSKEDLEAGNENFVSEKEIVIDGRTGIHKNTKRLEGGSRSNTYDYYTTKFTFRVNDYYYITSISDESQYIANTIIKELLEDIIPQENIIDENYEFKYFSVELDDHFYLNSYNLNYEGDESVILEGENLLSGLASIKLMTFPGQFNPEKDKNNDWFRFDFDGKVAYKSVEYISFYEGFRFRMYPNIVIIMDDRYLKIESTSDNSHGIEIYGYIDSIVKTIKLK